MKTIAIVPVYNEENHVLCVLEELERLVDRILVIDDGSTDSTCDRVENWVRGKQSGVVYRREKNGGKGQAIRFGFLEIQRLLETGELAPGDVVVNVDGDGQHFLNDIPAMVARLTEGGYDVVLACRDLGAYPLFKRWGNRLLSSVAELVSGFPYRDCESGMRCMRAKVVPSLLKYYRGYRYSDSHEIAVITALRGYRIDNGYVSKIRYYKPRGPSVWDARYILGLGLAASFRIRTGRERNSRPPHRLYRRIQG